MFYYSTYPLFYHATLILTSIASLTFGVNSNLVPIVSLLYNPDSLRYFKNSNISFLDTSTLSAIITASFFRLFYSANLRYVKYSFLAASKNNKSNFKSSLGNNSIAFPTTMSILSERPALAIFFLAVAAISLSTS